jgi:hypothetical protein
LGAVDGEGAGGCSIHRLRTTPLDVADVLPLADGAGRRHLDTGYGRIAADAGQAAAALEVMGGFALDPHWRRYLPPTMAPASTSAVDGYLEHPTETFADRKACVTRLVCEEKHPGQHVPDGHRKRFRHLAVYGAGPQRAQLPLLADEEKHLYQQLLDHSGAEGTGVLLVQERIPWQHAYPVLLHAIAA